MLSFSEFGVVIDINEKRKKNSVVFCFGRFQPITSGHEKMINRVVREAKNLNADCFVFPSHSHDNNRNPLKYEDKIRFLAEIFPEANLVDNAKITNPFIAMKILSESGYKHVTIVCGDDRLDKYKKFEEYNQSSSTIPGEFIFETINIVSIGKREGTISATYLREHVKNNKFDEFKKGLPCCIKDNLSAEIFEKIRNID